MTALIEIPTPTTTGGGIVEDPVTEAPAVGAPEGTSRASRRALLLAPASALLAAACAPSTPSPGLGAGITPQLAVDKLTFGPKPGLVAQVAAMGPWNWVEQQLAPASLPSAEALLAGPEYQSLRNTNLQNHALSQAGGQELLFDQMDHATLIRQVHSERQLYELMCDFWSDHFNLWRRHSYMGFLYNRDHETVIRPHALGRFRDLLVASAHSPAMLDYLDNRISSAAASGGVNQNYARELLELHTLGIIDGSQVYTEADVQACAQIMSGWTIQTSNVPTRYEFRFSGGMHDRRAVSAFGGAVAFPARAAGQGYEDGLALLEYLARHPSTARYISYKLVRRFVADTPPMGLVESAAAVFLAHDTQIVPVLRHILASAEFAGSADAKVRRPHEHLVATLRALGATFGTDPDGNSAAALRRALDDMGQPLNERVTPDGYPDIAPLWVSSNALIERWEVAGRIARNQLGNVSTADKVAVDLAALLPSPLPNRAVDLVWVLGQQLANIDMSTADATDICAAIGQTPGAAASTLASSASRLALATGLVFCHPLYQRR